MAKETSNNDKKEDPHKRLRDKVDKKFNRGKGFMYSKMEHTQLVSAVLSRDETIVELNAEISQLQRVIAELKVKLRKHEPERGDPPNYSGYDPAWPNVRKIVFILRRNFNALTSAQIVAEIIAIEPMYKIIWLDPANRISKLLGTACKNNLVKKINTPGMGAALYKAIRS